MSEGRRAARPVAEIVAQLDREALVELLVSAADAHEDVERSVRMLSARAAGDLRELKALVDRALRTPRFLGYRESAEWARAARPVVEQLEAAAREAPSAALVELLQRATAHVVETIMRADDSSGLIGDLARDLLDAHAVACDAGVADPVKLAAWMFRVRSRSRTSSRPTRCATGRRLASKVWRRSGARSPATRAASRSRCGTRASGSRCWTAMSIGSSSCWAGTSRRRTSSVRSPRR